MKTELDDKSNNSEYKSEKYIKDNDLTKSDRKKNNNTVTRKLRGFLAS